MCARIHSTSCLEVLRDPSRGSSWLRPGPVHSSAGHVHRPRFARIFSDGRRARRPYLDEASPRPPPLTSDKHPISPVRTPHEVEFTDSLRSGRCSVPAHRSRHRSKLRLSCSVVSKLNAMARASAPSSCLRANRCASATHAVARGDPDGSTVLRRWRRDDGGG